MRPDYRRPAARGSAASTPVASPSGANGTASSTWAHASDPAHALAVGTPVIYDCVRVRADGGGFASVVGSLEAPHTGAAGRVPPAPRWVPPAVASGAGVGVNDEAAAAPPPPPSKGKKDKKKKAKEAAATPKEGGVEKAKRKSGKEGSGGKKGRR